MYFPAGKIVSRSLEEGNARRIGEFRGLERQKYREGSCSLFVSVLFYADKHLLDISLL